MQVVGLVESVAHVCCRYRLAAFRAPLERAGHRLEFVPVPRGGWGWPGLLRRLRGADAVVLQRKLLPAWRLFLLRRAARVLLYDFDDAVFLRDSYAPKGLRSHRRRRRFQAVARAADAVLAGNDFLAAHARRGAGPGRVHVVPTCVDPADYAAADHTRAGAGVRLAWVGSSSTLRGLERARPILEEVGRRGPGVALHIICDRFPAFEHLPVVPHPWSEETERTALAAADVGISLVPDDDWSRGKCGLKVLQYMAAGLPVVANPVGVQAELVRPGETGFLAATPAEWADAVARLAGDPALRRRLGAAGRARVEAEYSVAAGAARWRALLDRLGRREAA